MKRLYTTATIICALLKASAQDVLWQKNIKTSTQDFLSQITTTIDGQYLITGSSIQSNKLQQDNKQNNGYDFHLIKLNQQGEEIWEKYFSGLDHDYLSATVATQDGGYLLYGTSFSGKGLDKKDPSKGGSDIWLIRVNDLGNELWQKTIGTHYDEEAKAVVQTIDSNFFLAGNVQNILDGYGSKDVWIVKLDKDGKELSQIILGGKGLDEVKKMIPTEDGGVLLGIYSRSDIVNNYSKSINIKQNMKSLSGDISTIPKQSNGFGEGDYWIVKLDRAGKIEWEKTFGGVADDHIRTLALTSNGYIIGGESRSDKSGNKSIGIENGTDLWLVSLNEKGDKQWEKSYNFQNRDVLTSMSVFQSEGFTKGFLLGGYTQTEGRIEKNDETFWILYLNEKGDEQWRKYIKGEDEQKEERLSDLKLNKDGSIVLGGTSAKELGKENWKIVKLKDQQIDNLIEKFTVKVYPNPVTDYAYIEIGFDFNEADIILYDMSGRQLQNFKTKNRVTKINTQLFSQGVYLVTINTDNKTANTKIIKK